MIENIVSIRYTSFFTIVQILIESYIKILLGNSYDQVVRLYKYLRCIKKKILNSKIIKKILFIEKKKIEKKIFNEKKNSKI